MLGITGKIVKVIYGVSWEDWEIVFPPDKQTVLTVLDTLYNIDFHYHFDEKFIFTTEQKRVFEWRIDGFLEALSQREILELARFVYIHLSYSSISIHDFDDLSDPGEHTYMIGKFVNLVNKYYDKIATITLRKVNIVDMEDYFGIIFDKNHSLRIWARSLEALRFIKQHLMTSGIMVEETNKVVDFDEWETYESILQ